MNDDEAKVLDYYTIRRELMRRYDAGTLILKESFSEVSTNAMPEARKLSEIARSQGFVVLDAYSNGHSTINKLIIGDLHYRPRDPEFNMFHQDIANMIGAMLKEGILKAGDTVCPESAFMEGTVDFSRSYSVPGKNRIRVVNGAKKVTVEINEKDIMILAYEMLRDSGLKARYSCSAEILERYDEKRELHRTERSHKTLFELDVVGLEMVEDFARFLVREEGRVVQIFGLDDLFPNIVQRFLRQAGESYMAIAPEEGIRSTMEFRKRKALQKT